MSELDYAALAFEYVRAGWMGVLPVPGGRKEPVPTGYSGYEDKERGKGKYPEKEDIRAWIDDGFKAKVDGSVQHFSSDGANLALRMPNTVIGVDVDAYDGKKGRECLAHAESLWGELPPTVRSSSRIDGISGIRLYRVPPGTILRTVITFPELGLDGIETVQYFHRYCMSWPSVHPTTGRRYRWLNHEGMPVTDLPLVGSIPNLPQAWVDALSRPPEEEITTRADVDEVVSGLDYGAPSQRVKDFLTKAVREIEQSAGGRHDETMRNIGRLLRLHHEEELGVGWALNSLHDTFVGCVTVDGSRTREMAESEWDRMLTGHRIHDKIASTPSRNKALEAVLGQKVPSLEVVMQARTDVDEGSQLDPNCVGLGCEHEEAFREAQSPNNDKTQLSLDDDMAVIMGFDANTGHDAIITSDDGLDEWDRILLGEEGVKHGARTSWGPQDLDELLEGDDFTPEQPAVGTRDDGARLFYTGKTNALIGPPESAKSWVAQYTAAQEIQAGNTVMYLDFEDSARGVVGRMRFLGVEKENIRERFLYATPSKALGEEEAAELFRTLDVYKPTLVIVDGMTAILSLHSYKTNDNDEVTKFYKLLLEPLAGTGAAVVVVDHVSKESAREDSGYALGAQMKLGALTGAQIRVTAVKKFGIGKEGKLSLTVHKDRPGGVRQNSEFRGKVDYWATVFVDARDTPNVRMTMRFETKEEAESPNNEGALHMWMTRISKYCADVDPDKKGVPKSKILSAVTGNKEDLESGLSELRLRGNIEERDLGPGRAKLQVLVRPYPEPEDDMAIILGPSPSE